MTLALTVCKQLIAGYALLAAPWLAKRKMAKAEIDQSSVGRVPLYQRAIGMQGLTTFGILAFWAASGVSRERFGLCSPVRWPTTLIVGGVFISYFAFTAVRLRSRAERFRDHMSNRRGALLLPTTRRELRWFATLSAGSGVAEELLYRAFLVFYVESYLPHPNKLLIILTVATVFGLAHLYQGFAGVKATTLTGLLLTTLYVVTGSLLLPVVIHSMGNLQGVVILWPQRVESAEEPV